MNDTEAHLNVEQELRMILNILLNSILYNLDDESMLSEFINSWNMIEENSFKAIKFSLEIAVVPIRKLLIIFYIYLKVLFEEAQGTLISCLIKRIIYSHEARVEKFEVYKGFGKLGGKGGAPVQFKENSCSGKLLQEAHVH